MMDWDVVKATISDGHIRWRDLFDERQRKEIRFNMHYAEDFAHGTDGHNLRLICAKMADILDAIQVGITFTEPDENDKYMGSQK